MSNGKVYKGRLKVKQTRKGVLIQQGRDTILDKKMKTVYRKVDKQGLHWCVTKRGSSIIDAYPIKAIKIEDKEQKRFAFYREMGYVQDSRGNWHLPREGEKDNFKPKNSTRRVYEILGGKKLVTEENK